MPGEDGYTLVRRLRALEAAWGRGIPALALTAHARHVAARDRGQFLEDVRRELAAGGLLLETCHRVELFTTDEDQARRLTASLPAGGRPLAGAAAIRHAMAVATGRDSVVVGEDQVLHQLRRALDAATAAGIDPVLERLMATALRAGRRARTWGRGPARSLADVAIGTIERRTGPIGGREVLVVGAGRMGALAATAARRAGASVAIANRSPGRAAQLATANGGRAVAFDPGPGAGAYDAIVVALSGPWRLARGTVDAIATGGGIVVDLSVPPAVPDHLAGPLGRRLVTADDLAQATPDEPGTTEGHLARLDALIEEATAEFLGWLDGRDRRAAAHALIERADREREAELAELWRRLPGLDADERATIEGMSRHLAKRLLREPLERLGTDADGRHERAVRELWAL